MTRCPHRPPCSGCPRFGEPDIGGTARRALDELAHAHGVPAAEVISGRTAGYRVRARLAIRGRLGSPKLGLFEHGTHRVVHIPGCSVQHPLINHVASIVRRALVETRLTSYSDKAHLGLARYLQIVIERSSQTAQVVLVANTTQIDPLIPCFELLRERLGTDLHSLWFNSHVDRSNTVLGTGFHRWCGADSVVERFGGAAVHYPPGAFGQSNLEIGESIINHLRYLVPEGARVAEFYAGVGAIGLSILERVSELHMNEIGTESLRGLELGLAELDSSTRSRIQVTPGAAGASCAAASQAEVVIADPPRKGLDAELTMFLAQNPPERFIYVSCGFESLQRDAAQLTAGGKLRLRHLTAFNLMPFTEHVETVACFDRH